MPVKRKTSKEDRAQIESFVFALNKKGIKLLALDFDQTLIDIHSGGVWNESVEELVQHVRPCMKDLLEIASNKGLFVAIVTYHRQDWLIKDLLTKVISKKVANKVYIQANTPEFLKRLRDASEAGTCTGRGIFHEFNGKEAHIASVINEIKKDHNQSIKKEEVILMDDDMNNVRVASSFGHYAFEVQQNVDYSSFESFETMLLV